nr:hypothetical protein CFP56_71358 [Quercus suber]
MNASNAGVLGLNDGFENKITSFNSHATKENSLVPRCVVGFRDDEEHVSSSLKLFGSLQMGKDDARAVSDFDEQLQLLDREIDSSPNLSKLQSDNLDAVSVNVPILNEVDATPNFSHVQPCINVSTAGQELNEEVINYEEDSLEAIPLEEFNIGQTFTSKGKKTSRGRPRKFTQGDLLTTGITNQVYLGNSVQIVHTPKKTCKRIAVKKEISEDKSVAGLDIGERRKSADLDGKEDHSVDGEKRNKIEKRNSLCGEGKTSPAIALWTAHFLQEYWSATSSSFQATPNSVQHIPDAQHQPMLAA